MGSKVEGRLPPILVYSFKVKRPLPGASGAGWVWTSVSAYGVDEDDAVREVVEGYPDAVELMPLTWGARTAKPVPEVVCPRPEGAGGFCSWCGQDPVKHPITSDMAESSEARRWLEAIYAEGSGPAGGWD